MARRLLNRPAPRFLARLDKDLHHFFKARLLVPTETTPEGIRHAAAKVVMENLIADAFKSSLDRRYLREQVDAELGTLGHPLQTAYLPFDASKAQSHPLLSGDVKHRITSVPEDARP